MDPLKKIQKILSGIDKERKNNTDYIYLNVVMNEFITFNGRIEIPKISVKELFHDTAITIIERIVEYIPEFLYGHLLLDRRIPPSEQHSLQFVRRARGKVVDFIHMFKIDMQFGGDSSNILERGDSDHYPSYITDRVYYKSRLIPVLSSSVEEPIKYFNSIRLFDTAHVESDQYFHTFAVFEDVNKKELTKEILNKMDNNIFNISTDLYPFIIYDYFTSCFNVLYPSMDEVDNAVKIYEPIFLSILSKYKTIEEILPLDLIKRAFPKSLTYESDALMLNGEFLVTLKEYFKRFSIMRDDELALKGWWRIEIDK